MDLQKIKALIDLLSSSGLTELELVEGECRLRLSRSEVPASTRAEDRVGAPSGPAPAATTDSGDETAAAPDDDDDDDDDAHLVKAPMFGMFCLTPAPDAPPFVRVGDAVQKGQRLCLIEAMKLFHALNAERDGRIAAILAENGQEVDAGQPLFRFE
jgi:acetyl-CoA carboxylase biotin carboxyl carrier protein